VTAMKTLNSRNCIMLFYYQIVTCLLVTCATAAGVLMLPTWVCMSMRLCFSVKNSFSDVIINEHLTKNSQQGYGVGSSTIWGLGGD